MRLAQRLTFFFSVLVICAQAAGDRHPGKVLVVTAGASDYIAGAGGTLALFALEGYDVHLAQFGNDEKDSAGLSPAEKRRVVLLRDCMSPVSGFESQAESFFADARSQGVRIESSDEALAGLGLG